MTVSCGRMFRLYDDDGNKNLTFDELKTGLRDYGVELTDSEVHELFRLFDTDGTGTISFDELLIALRVRLNQRRRASHRTQDKA